MDRPIADRIGSIVFGIGITMGSAVALSPFGLSLYEEPVSVLLLGCVFVAGLLLIVSGLRESISVGTLTLNRYSVIGVADVLLGISLLIAGLQLVIAAPDRSALQVGSLILVAGVIGIGYGTVQYRTAKPVREIWTS